MRDQHRGSSMDGGSGSGASAGGRPLKSLLKKPGQPKAKKNRVVINEKMNEFFAADYIILIKEECCGDYEEECDCCCQEHEMIRLGNCRECRAELKLGNLMSSSGPDDECGEDDDDEDEDEDECDDDEDECDEDEADEDEPEHRQRHHHQQRHQQLPPQHQHLHNHQQQQCDERECRHAALEQQQQQQQQHAQQRKLEAERRRQRETLSPPEGYKDLCSAAQAQQELDEGLEDADAVCAECDYYQRQAAAEAAAAAASANCAEDGASRQPIGADESKSGHLQDGRRSVSGATPSAQDPDEVAIDQPQPTQPGEVGQRYLVETITMTTVTERRIVREISEEESRPAIDESDSGGVAGDKQKSIEAAPGDGASVKKNGPTAEAAAAAASPGGVGVKGDEPAEREKPAGELSLGFKLGGSLVTGNSLKPNSAVRQLFPDPRFISPPPPAPSKANSAELEDAALDAALGEPHKFLITADNLRLFDAKRSKLGPASRSDSSESDSSIKRTIERNALRRSLIKYDTGSLRRKNLRSMDLTLEERIRQLTCVDEDEAGPDGGLLALEPGATNGSAYGAPANTGNNNSVGGGGGSNGATMNGLGGRGAAEGLTDEQLGAAAAGQQLPPRTSPNGEERPRGHVVQSHGGHNHHHHHHHNSAYKKITELFGPKKSSGSAAELSLPDIGLGGKHSMAVKSGGGGGGGGSKLTSEARRQFLASLAPLSCVAANSADGRDEYYRMPAKPVDRAASAAYNSDSSYSLEDIEDALSEGIPAPPDVTRGTPTSAGPSLDSFAAAAAESSDELLAFVEQDKSRTERIKKRYSDGCDEQLQQQQQQRRPNNNNNNSNNNNNINSNSNNHHSEAIEIPTNHVRLSKDEDNDDDELNDYGFNRRPSVRGIKAQFETTNEIVRQLRSRSAAANSLPEACRLGFQPSSSSSSAAAAAAHDDELGPAGAGCSSSSSDVYRVTYTNEVHADANTINRINNMQKQINDIYQSIAENSVTAALLDQQPRPTGPLGYLDGTLPRTMVPQTDACHRFVDHKNGLINPARMLRIAGPGDGGPGSGPVTPAGVYSTLPKVHRHPQLSAAYSAAAAYSAGVVPAAASVGSAAAAAAAAAKCYRTMYFVPYNGASDPTYQNIQKALPPHSSPTNYAEHLERYPYPRNGRIDQQQHQQQQQQLQQRYYVRPASVPNTQTTSGALHLHLHQTEELQVSATGPAVPSRAAASLPHPSLVHPMHSQLQQVQQQQQQQQQQSASAYSVQTLSGVTYSICPPPPMSQTSATYTYQMQIQGRLSAGDTSSSLQGSLSSVGLASSPTKALIQRSCSVAERGVPEGAASAPSHDFGAMGQPGQGPPAAQSSEPPILDAQNPVYYAMNV